jgi:ketosteroid isomerase-like protein
MRDDPDAAGFHRSPLVHADRRRVTLELLLAEREIQRLMIRYLDRIDARDVAGIAALFTDDAVADFLTGRAYRGPERIAAALERITAHFERTSHHLTNHIADVDLARGEADAVTYVYAFHRMAATGAAWHFWGRHVDRLRRVGDTWLLADRRLVGVDAEPARDDVPRELFAGHGAAALEGR